jgi:hypothetical protein
VDGVLVFDQDDKDEAVDTFFEHLLGSAPKHVFSIHLDFLGIRTHDMSKLEAPFSKEEVWGVVRAQELDKAPGSDGFSSRLYVACWYIIKLLDICEMSLAHHHVRTSSSCSFQHQP